MNEEEECRRRMMSRSGSSLGGPSPCLTDCSLDKPAKSGSIRHFRKTNLNTYGPTHSPPPSLGNRFEILDKDDDLSSSEPSEAPFDSVDHDGLELEQTPLPDPTPSLPTNLLASFDPILAQPINHRSSPRAMNPTQNRNQPYKPTPKAQPSWGVVGQKCSTPSSPKSGPTPKATGSSSIGHTPFHSNIPCLARTIQKNTQPYSLNPGSIFNSVRKNHRSFSSDLLKSMMSPSSIPPPPETSRFEVEEEAVGEEKEQAIKKANNRPLDQQSKIRMIETWEDLEDSLRDPDHFVRNDEDVEEEDEEEAGGIEEDDDEDDAEEDDDEHEREVKEEDVPKRKVSTDYGKYGDYFLQTTDRDDPRRIRFC